MKRSQIRSLIRAAANTPFGNPGTSQDTRIPVTYKDSDAQSKTVNEVIKTVSQEAKVEREYKKLIDTLSGKFDALNGFIADIPRKGDKFSVPLYKAVLEGLNNVKTSIDNKPVPHWQWPQYAAVSVRDKNFANINPAVAYQDASTTESAPYGTLPVFDHAGTIAKVSDSVGLPVNIVAGSVAITSSSMSGLQVNLTKATTSVLSGIHVNQTSSYDASIVDANNTTTATLAGNASFTGTGTDVLNYSFINILLYSDVSSASNGVKLEFSNDNTNWDDSSLFTFSAGGTPPNAGQTFGASPRGRYFRVVYTNGSSAQSAFRMTTVLKKNVSIGDQMTMTLVPNSTNHALLTKSSIVGLTTAGGSSFVDVKVNPSGSLTVAIDSTTIAGLKVNVTQLSTPVVAGIQTDVRKIGGSLVATVAAGVQKVGVADSAGTAITSTGSALDVNLKTSSITLNTNISAATTTVLAGTKVLVTTHSVGLSVKGTDVIGTSGPTALTVQGIPSGTALNSATAATVIMGMRNSAGNAFYAIGVSDNADGYAVTANGNVMRVMAEGALFNGSTYDRARGVGGATLVSTNAVGLRVNLTQVSTPTLAGTKVFVENFPATQNVSITAATTSTLAGTKILSEGRAQNAEATATTNGSTVASAHDLVGKQIILPYANPENFINGSTKLTTTASSQVVAGVASTRLYITTVTVTNTSATSTYLKLQDGSGGTVLMYIPLPSTGGATITLPTPIKTTAGNGLFASAFNAATTIFITGVGWKGV